MTQWRFLTAAAIFSSLATLAAIGPMALADSPPSPVVVELFTSQGCSSCPPADAYLGELAKQPNLVALAFHVDYWDYIGWKDPFASAAATDRQRRYAERLGKRYLYTPEIVVDGAADATGSDREAVDELIQKARKTGPKIAIAVSEPKEEHYVIALPEASYQGSATLWVAMFTRKKETQVARGENEGRMARDYNAVQEMKRVGRWNGKAQTVELDMGIPAGSGCAVLLQADVSPGDGRGQILGAALFQEDKKTTD